MSKTIRLQLSEEAFIDLVWAAKIARNYAVDLVQKYEPGTILRDRAASRLVDMDVLLSALPKVATIVSETGLDDRLMTKVFDIVEDGDD